MSDNQKNEIAGKEMFRERIDLEEKTEVEKDKDIWLKIIVFIVLAIAVVLTVLAVVIFIRAQDINKIEEKTGGSISPDSTVVVKPTVAEDETIKRLERQGDSDEITSIQADIETTDFSGLDKELDDIEKEIAAP